MPIAKFEMPDGKVAKFEVPEGMTPEEATAEVERMIESGELEQPQAQPQAPMQPPAQQVPGMPAASTAPAAPPPTFPGMPSANNMDMASIGKIIQEGAKVGGRGIYEAVMGIPNLTEQLAEWMVPQALKAQGERPDLGLAMPSRKGFEGLVEPDTKMGRALSNILASAAAAVTGGGAIRAGSKVAPKILGQMSRVGAASGVGGEAAGQVTDDNPTARIAGSLLGGGGYGLLSGIGRGVGALAQGHGKRATLARQVTEGLSEEDLLRATELQKLAASQGVKLTSGQALPGTNVPAFEQFAVSQPTGAPLTKILRDQPPQVINMMKNMEGGIPGANLPPSQLNTAIKQAATGALKDVRKYRAGQTRPGYTAEITPESAKGLQKAIKDEIKKLPSELDDVKALQKLRMALTNKVVKKKPDGTMKVTRVPLTKTQDINKAFRSVKNSLAKPGEGGKQFSKEVRNKVERVINDLKRKIGEEVPEYGEADQLFARISRQVVNPMKEGPAGKMAGASEYIPGQASTTNYLTGLFSKGVSGKGRSEIELARRQLTRAGPEGKKAFDDAFKTWFSDNLADAMKFDKGGVSPDTAKSLHSKFFGSSAKRQAFREGLRGVARNNGQDVDTVVKGMENTVKTLELAAARPVTPGMTGGQVAESAETLAKKMAAFTYLLPARIPLRMLNEYLKKDALGWVSETLATPGGIQTLAKMAAAEPGSKAAQNILGEFTATLVQPALAKPEEK